MDFEAVVIGAGHAGVEAALALARRGHKVLAAVIDSGHIASMPCNPSVGGPAKGIVVREIDALGGQMGKSADATALQFKMLNESKGPGVRSLRVQSDKIRYRQLMREILTETPNLTVKEGLAEELDARDGKIAGVRFADGTRLSCRAVILTTGTYLSSAVMAGSMKKISGPEELGTSYALGDSIRSLGLRTFRLKTGTPPRLARGSIDFSGLEPEPGNIEDEGFSYETDKTLPLAKQALCYLTYTNERTHRLIRDNLDKCSLMSGMITGVGPRYCPSIETKLIRFADKPRHQLFLEPESLSLDTTYLQGFSNTMPYDIQEEMVHSIAGLEHAEIRKYSYAIEYDAIDPRQLKPSLAAKAVAGLFCAGQINGTSGYEEAAGQGLIAGINAANWLEGREPLVLKRDEAYIGVMIDDLVTKGTNEPYRLLTSRAEYRLLLRHDNADQRLTGYGYSYGLISEERYRKYLVKLEQVADLRSRLHDYIVAPSAKADAWLAKAGYGHLANAERLAELLKRPRLTLEGSGLFPELDPRLRRQAEIEIKYAGYIDKEKRETEHLRKLERLRLGADWDYERFDQLSLEARQKLNEVHPLDLAQASRISGINPADLAVLAMEIKRRQADLGSNKS